MVRSDTAHILVDDRGVAWIDDSNVKVIEVALDWIAHGSSPDEMHLQYPHLSIAQICAALAYYHDHQAEFDEQIARDRAPVQALREQGLDSPARRKLRGMGLLP